MQPVAVLSRHSFSQLLTASHNFSQLLTAPSQNPSSYVAPFPKHRFAMASLLEFLGVFILGVFVGATATTFWCKRACRQDLVDDEYALVDTMAAPEGLVDDVEPLQKKQKVPLLEPRAAAASSANRIQLPENEVTEIPKWLCRQLS